MEFWSPIILSRNIVVCWATIMIKISSQTQMKLSFLNSLTCKTSFRWEVKVDSFSQMLAKIPPCSAINVDKMMRSPRVQKSFFSHRLFFYHRYLLELKCQSFIAEYHVWEPNFRLLRLEIPLPVQLSNTSSFNLILVNRNLVSNCPTICCLFSTLNHWKVTYFPSISLWILAALQWYKVVCQALKVDLFTFPSSV